MTLQREWEREQRCSVFRSGLPASLGRGTPEASVKWTKSDDLKLIHVLASLERGGG